MTTSCCSQPSLSALLNVNKANLTIWQRNTDVWKGIRTPTCSAGRAGVRGWVQVKSSVKRAFDTLVDSAVFQRISWEFVVFSFGLSMRRRVNLAWEQQSQTRKEHVCWLIRNCITEVLWHLERPSNHYIHESPVQMQGVCEPRTLRIHSVWEQSSEQPTHSQIILSVSLLINCTLLSRLTTAKPKATSLFAVTVKTFSGQHSR